MKQTPHPSTLAAISSATGRRLQTSDVDDVGRRRERKSYATDYVAKNVAGYRFPDGRVSTAYDMYKPTYPEGAEPGLVDVKYGAQFYANETSGHKKDILAFRSVEDLTNDGLVIDMTAAALARNAEGVDQIVVGDNETALEDILLEGEFTDVKRVPITIPTEFDGGLRFFFASSAIGGTEIHAADTEDNLAEMLGKRFSFLNPETDDLSGILDAIEQHVARPDISWRIAHLDHSDEPEFDPGY